MGGGPTGFAAHCNPMAKEAPTTARAKMSVVPAYVGRAARQVGRCDRGKPQPPRACRQVFRVPARRLDRQRTTTGRPLLPPRVPLASAIREGLDPDIVRFARDQAAAWQLLSASQARSARDALIPPEIEQ